MKYCSARLSKIFRALPLLPGLLLLYWLALLPPLANGETTTAVVLEIKGAIGPAVSDYFMTGLAEAAEQQAAVVVLQLDTPGGLDLSMRDMIKAILNSPLPVMTYVSPEGARAASAGTYLLYASHIAAMAPATNLGAATPVQIGAPPDEGADKGRKKDQAKEDESVKGGAMQRKIIHDAAAYIRSLAERHGRNGEWAEKAVREAVSLTAEEALKLHVIEIVAADLGDLLRQADGREVHMASGTQVLATADLVPVFVRPTWRNRLLAIVSDPNIAYLLLLIGIYGLIYELANPGVFFPGVAGTIALLLALYGFQILPVNYSGLALLLLGIGLMTSEAFVPSFGSLGIGGIVAFAAGSLILFDEEYLRISRTFIFGTTLVSALGIIWLAGRLVTFRKQRSRTGSEAMAGMTGEASEDFCHQGRIWLAGESWEVRCDECLKKGTKVRVSKMEGLILTVEKLQEDN